MGVQSFKFGSDKDLFPKWLSLLSTSDNSRCHLLVPNLPSDVIKWNHFPRYWPFVRGIHRSPVNSPHKGQ